MASRPLYPHMTVKRLQWLRALERDGPQPRVGRGTVGFQCMQLGWTEWDYRRISDGSPITRDEAREQYGDQWFDHVDMNQNERLTDEGRRVLAEHGSNS